MANPGFPVREYIHAIASLGWEYAAPRYSIRWLAWAAAFLLWLRYLIYTKNSFKEIKWQRYGARIGSAILIGAITFLLLKQKVSPSVNLYFGNAELNGQTIDATYAPGTGEHFEPGSFVLKDIRAEQTGRFPTEKVIVVLYFSEKVICEPGVYECYPIRANGGFPGGFQWTGLPPVNPEEPWPVPEFRGVEQGNSGGAMKARLEVFYGESIPAEADFFVIVRNGVRR